MQSNYKKRLIKYLGVNAEKTKKIDYLFNIYLFSERVRALTTTGSGPSPSQPTPQRIPALCPRSREPITFSLS